jgi:hypothetical protein
MDITLMYTDEEKCAFEEEHEAHVFLEKKEADYYEIEREWNSHTQERHTDIVSPIVFTLLAAGAWLSTAFFFKSIFPFWAIVTVTPAFGVFFTVLAIYFWVRYAKQIKLYTQLEEELERNRKRAFRELQAAKQKYEEKKQVSEAITYNKHVEKRKADEEASDPQKFEALFHKD